MKTSRQAYMREWRKRPEVQVRQRDYQERWRTANPQKVKEYNKEYNQAHKRECCELKKKWQRNNLLIVKSQSILHNAIRDGKIIKPDICSACNVNNKIEGHHSDYGKPLNVIWLCSKCHHNLHMRSS